MKHSNNYQVTAIKNHRITNAARSVAEQGGYLQRMLLVFSECELKFMFAICHRPSVCRLSVTFVRPTQAIEIFGNISTPFGTMAIY